MPGTGDDSGFPARNAVIEAVAQRRLAELQQYLPAITATERRAWQRIEDLFAAVVRYFESMILEEGEEPDPGLMQFLLEIEAVRLAGREGFVAEFYDFLRAELVRLVRAGVASGEMHVDDPEESAAALLDCLVRVVEPVLLLQDPRPLRERRTARQLRLLARAFR